MIFILTILVSLITLALGFIVCHFSKSHNAARKNSVLLTIAGVILIIGGIASLSLNVYIYEKYKKEGKLDNLLPFLMASPQQPSAQ
jgi:drug/metabolite transporter (DMT)-like permease